MPSEKWRIRNLKQRRANDDFDEISTVNVSGLMSVVVIVVASHYGTATNNHIGVLAPQYHKWLDEDVRWIISVPEEKEFLKLTTDEQRDRFVVQFWERRNPKPGSKENTFKEEHYRRLAFMNQHFAANVPGWKTDRGHVYVVYGTPDSVIKHASLGKNPPEELWTYRHMPGVDGNVTLRFVDRCACGEFLLATDLPKQKD